MLQADIEREIKAEKEIQVRVSDPKTGQIQDIDKELTNAEQYIYECEEKVEKSTRRSLELLRQLKEAETEIETLKHYIIELKQRIAVYIPVKDDVIDRKLAEYINNYPERAKLKIMFMRESEGIYQFGTRRVYVRVEKDKINSKIFINLSYYLQFVSAVVTSQLMSFLTNILLQNWKSLREKILLRSSQKRLPSRRPWLEKN